MPDPTSGTIEYFGIRWNWGTETLEMNTGNETWVPVPGVGETITVNEVNSGEATDGQVITADGAGAATWEDVVAAPGGNDMNIQVNASGVMSGSDSLTFDAAENLMIIRPYDPGTYAEFQVRSENNHSYVDMFCDNSQDGGPNFTTVNMGVVHATGSAGAPDASAILDLQSGIKGFLPPRLTTVQREAIATPATGLMVWDADLEAICVSDGTDWYTLDMTVIA